MVIMPYDIPVFCHRDNRTYIMPMEYTRLDNGKNLFRPCNGCDNCTAAHECLSCMSAVNRHLFADDVDTNFPPKETFYPPANAKEK